MDMTTVEADTSPAAFAKMVKERWFKEYEIGGEYGWMDNINPFKTIGDL